MELALCEKELLIMANGVLRRVETNRTLTVGANILNGVQKVVSSNLTVPTSFFC
jgi:hypothetical protein